MQKLTTKPSRFVDEYLTTSMPLRPPFEQATAKGVRTKIGSQLLGKTRVQTAIQVENMKLSAHTDEVDQ